VADHLVEGDNLKQESLGMNKSIVAGDFVADERIICGGENDYATVRHLVLKGSQKDIGRHLAMIAKERYGSRFQPSANALEASVQMEYLRLNWPMMYSRIEGAAEVYGVDIEANELFLQSLLYSPGGELPMVAPVYSILRRARRMGIAF
jgi:hypothetical protein